MTAANPIPASSNDDSLMPPAAQPPVAFAPPANQALPQAPMDPTTPAGWYPAPEAGLLRWWDGTAWTAQYAPDHNSGQRRANLDPPKDILAAYLLWFFFGLVGVHRFYLKHTRTGLGYLGIWAVAIVTSLLGLGAWPALAVYVWLFVDIFLMPWMVRKANASQPPKYW